MIICLINICICFDKKKSLNIVFLLLFVVDISSSFERAQLIQNQLYVDKIIVNTYTQLLYYICQSKNQCAHKKKPKVIPVS